ncbi:TPA: hypothetical protein RQK84_003271 [Vibrio vulnificus]|nr:MvdC family ATP-grasp ribosomal peptide maturase [Vibrio vulnificus]HDY8015183.1 hypothetical protein [Vibrio vulnificus]
MILCITHSQDSYPVDWVAAHLEHLGHALLRFNSDQFPLSAGLSGEINQATHQAMTDLTIEGADVSAKAISAVWHRKNALADLTACLHGDTLQQAVRESEAIKQGLLHSLDSLFWLDPPAKQKQAENKWLQLQLAQNVGLTVPDTLFTNQPERVRQFFQRCQGQVVVKMHTPLMSSMGKPGQFVYTSRLEKAHLDSLDSLKFSPMIFQRQIEKAQEIRAVYVDGTLMCASILGRVQSGEALVDWRKADPQLSSWQPAQLPPDVHQAVHRLMQKLQLKFGAIDFIVDHEQTPYFLEVNPAGEWGMLEQALGLPISRHIAETLVKYAR